MRRPGEQHVRVTATASQTCVEALENERYNSPHSGDRFDCVEGNIMARKGGYRSYIDVDTIPMVNTELVSTGSCASLVQHYTRVGHTSKWKQGETVRRNTTIKKGTAIATFVDGEYPNDEHGNHAALYVSQDANGIKVVDQWEGEQGPHFRVLSFKGKTADGSGWDNPSNNGDAFSIIEL